MDCRKDLTAGGGLGFCCSSEGKSDEMIKHGDLRREDTTDLRCVRRDEGPDRTVRAAILGCFKDNQRSYRVSTTYCIALARVSKVRPSDGGRRRRASTGFADLLLQLILFTMRILRSVVLLAGFAATATDAVAVGDAIPSNVDLHFGFPPEIVNVGERVAKKKVIVS